MTYSPQPGWQAPYPPRGVPWPQYPNPNFPPQPPPPPPGYGAAYGQPHAAPPYPSYPYGPPKRSRKASRKALWVTLSLLGLAAVAATTVLIVVGTAGPSDEAQIRSVIGHFAQAVDSGDLPKARTYMCAEESEQIPERDDGASDTVAPVKRLPVNVTDVRVNGDAATAELSRPPQKPRTLRLTKQAGTWKICDPGPP